ncbi:hypothetical protein JY651_14520 [Pyxidicoccus parkwayensis]|jgi:hypothetical protein|uniref:Uncharacterized protein n=1 Tax=Pyxidicoccus parkwayensis TaxID=2813578 RepID=A0ABX7P6G1_9BACT|nr:hypothetical protein [Pyxidicoccus parkwaysis]QSQ26059.1 hypothetical protein JY651_14520 [Pyxidicoccus parkwaysis]
MASLTAEELLAGAAGTFTVSLPANVLKPGTGDSPTGSAGEVVLRPLQIRDVERVSRAAKEQRVLTSVLMVQQALVSPKLTVEQVGSLSAGLVQFLLEKVNAISGLSLGEDDLDSAVKAPLAKACFVLAKEFGWTPAECSELTVGQVLLYLEMLARDGQNGGE